MLSIESYHQIIFFNKSNYNLYDLKKKLHDKFYNYCNNNHGITICSLQWKFVHHMIGQSINDTLFSTVARVHYPYNHLLQICFSRLRYHK